jgi:hypothetical protein
MSNAVYVDTLAFFGGLGVFLLYCGGWIVKRGDLVMEGR